MSELHSCLVWFEALFNKVFVSCFFIFENLLANVAHVLVDCHFVLGQIFLTVEFHFTTFTIKIVFFTLMTG